MRKIYQMLFCTFTDSDKHSKVLFFMKLQSFVTSTNAIMKINLDTHTITTVHDVITFV